jgi:hypothetical protein
VARLLSKLAIARQYALSEDCVKVYLSSLTGFDLRDIEAGVEHLCLQPRQDFKPVFPELGELVRCIADAARERRAATLGRFQYCDQCRYGLLEVKVAGLDGRQERAVKWCSCVAAWAARREAEFR